MSDLYPVAGSKIFIGDVLASKKTDFIEADFAGQTWTEIDGFTNMGSIGDTNQLITTAVINRNRDIKQKGTSNAGQMQCQFAQLVEDPGQIELIAASQTKDNYAFKIELNDADGGAPSKRLFIALVMNAEEAGGNANTIRNLNSTLEINSNIVRVAAT